MSLTVIGSLNGVVKEIDLSLFGVEEGRKEGMCDGREGGIGSQPGDEGGVFFYYPVKD